MRLFFAIQLEETIKDCLCGIMENMKQSAVQGNFTRRENLHLTLAFLGETNRLEAAQRAMNQTGCRSFSLALEGLGKFARKGGNLYWVGFRESEELFSLQKMLSQNLSDAGFVLEKRRYTPHLTLGREIVLPQGIDERTFQKLLPPLTMQVNKISLMRSQRIQGKLTYTELCAKRLE